MKNTYIEDLREGARFDDVFLVSGKSIGKTQDGATFLRIKLVDRTGNIDGIKWDANESTCSSFTMDDYVQARGVVNRYKDKLQVVFESIRKWSEKVDPADFLPKCAKDMTQMMDQLRSIIATVKHPQLKALLLHFFDDPKFATRFSTAPAAMKIHHACIGGLLEHSLSVAQLCDSIASHFPEANRDLLITGAIMHDVGKIDEFSWAKSIRYSDSGHLVGHVVGGAMMVDTAAAEIPGFHPLLRLVLTHIMLSHHGEKDFGSPKRPKCVESLILHYVEDLDAKVKTFTEAVGSAADTSESELWTDRHWVFDRPLLKGLPKALLGNESEAEADADPFAE